MSRNNFFTNVLLGITLCAPIFAQDQPKPAEKPKNPEVIAPSTGCEAGQVEAVIECQKREALRLLIIMGRPEVAMKVLCTTKVLREAFANNLDACQKSN